MGVSTSEIITYDGAHPPEKWEKITDDGWIRGTHNPKGNAIYVVSLGVSPQARGMKIGSLLITAQKTLVKTLGCECLVLGARCPEYSQPEFDEIPIAEYVELRRENNQMRDMELRFYEGNGLRVIKPMAYYMDEDLQSRHYGVVMVWGNQDSEKPERAQGAIRASDDSLT